MTNRMRTPFGQPAHVLTRAALLTGLILCLLTMNAGVVRAASGNTSGYAWGTNVGWINFNPTSGGVAVYSDHLEGYAWGENIGWIRLGTCTGGSPCAYANTTATNYGVNNDGSGNLSGYAWGTNIGWINFNPTNGGVTINTSNGQFDGYAWGENVGWIHFKNASPAYNVVTTWDGKAAATTNAATSITSSGATLNGTVNANNTSTTVTFEYGLTTSYGTTVTATPSPVSGTTDTAVSKAITGLTCGTTYHFRVVGTNSAGTTNGSDATFTTSVCPTLSVSIGAASIAENAGASATTVTITRNTETTSPLTINLSSSDTSEATVPATATISAGQASVTVNLTAVDDASMDGTQTVTITASLTGFTSGSDTIQVTDNEAATVIFHANGGTGTMDAQVSGVATALTSNVFTWSGYSFAGWDTVALGGGTTYADGASYPFTADVTLYAQWTALPFTSASLSNLVLSSGALSPSFAFATFAYSADVPNSLASITVTPTAIESHATITVNGTAVTSGSASAAIALNVGANTITVGVTALDGTTKRTYIVTVTRASTGGGGVIAPSWVIIASDGLYPERVRVDWTATTGASYYLVYRSESLDGPKIPTEGVRTTSLGGDDQWALPGVTYYYWVRACTESGCGEFYTYHYDSGWRGLAAPVISASDGLFSDRVHVSWPAVFGASSYLGYRAGSLAGTQIPVNGYLTSFPGGDDQWALPGVNYFYWVKACNGLNCSPLSAVDTGWR